MKISVALCTYNGEKYLSEQLSSILGQTKSINEIIICDDNSSDSTIQLIKDFQSRYPSIIELHINEQNLGGKKNFEKALSLCTGDIIFFSDQDDLWLPDKVEVIETALNNNPQCLGAFSDAYLINDKDEYYDFSFLDSFGCMAADRTEIIKNGPIDYVLTYNNIVAGAMLAIKKEALSFIYPFKLMDKMWHDEWITLVLSSMNKFLFVNKKLVKYRLHAEQQLGIGEGDNNEGYIQYLKILKDHNEIKKHPLDNFSHTWMGYSKICNYEGEINELRKFKNAYKDKFEHSKVLFLSQYNFFQKKARIVKWLINKEFDTTWKDVFKL